MISGAGGSVRLSARAPGTHLLLSAQVHPAGGESRLCGAEPCVGMEAHTGSCEAARWSARPASAASSHWLRMEGS